MIRVKICGITNKEDALIAASLGADAIGIVNVKESRRFTSVRDAREIFQNVPPFVSRVIVANPVNIKDFIEIEKTGADCVQLHGEESIELIKEIRENSTTSLIKQVPVVDESSIDDAVEYSKFVDAILLDTKVKGVLGGSGIVHDWDISRKIVDLVKKPVILAGGLNPENVKGAIDTVNPYAVDVASGVETNPGNKDKNKVEKFIRIAKNGTSR